MRALHILCMLLGISSFVFAKDYTFYALSNHGANPTPVYLCVLDGKTGGIEIKKSFGGVTSANYFAITNDKTNLLVSSKSTDGKSGGLVQYSILPDGTLQKAIEQFKPGGMPCYVHFTNDEKFAMSASYGDDKISLYRFTNNLLSGETDTKVQEKKARGHYIAQAPNGPFIHAVFLGMDKVLNYKIENGKYIANPHQQSFALPPGQGPRHMVIHPKKPFAYILNEVGSTVTACGYNHKEGVLTTLQHNNMLPEDFTEFSKAAAIRIHPNGKYVYASNRGHNSIAVYKILKDGKLERIQIQGKGINFPRDFVISPDGKWMIVGNEHGNSVITYKVNTKTGMLVPTGNSVQIQKPLAFIFFK